MIRADTFDLGDVFKILVAVLFFVIPVVKSLIDKRRKEAEEARQGTGGRASRREEEGEGGEQWKKLLRGEATIAPGAPATLPRPSAPARSLPPPPLPVEGPPDPLVVLDQGGLAPLTAEEDLVVEAPLDEGVLAEQLALERARDELRRQREIAGLEREASSPRRRSVEPVPVDIFAAPPSAIPKTVNPAVRDLLGGESARDRRAALKRAVLTAEILGEPVSMRSAGSSTGPVGLRT